MMVQTLPAHVNAGKKVRCPNTAPCVVDEAPMSDTRMVEVVPVRRVTVIWYCPPYTQSRVAIVKDGCGSPLER